MPAALSPPTRRSVLAGSAIMGAASLLPASLTAAAAASDTPAGQTSNQGDSSIDSEVDNTLRPFQFNAPDEALADLRRRIAATHWPDRETVADPSQGVQLATMQELARYWGTDYDWRKIEARLNALPQFVTEIDGLDIHFIHVRSKQRKCAADDRHARMARLDHRAAEDHRSADQPDRAWRDRIGRVSCGDPVAAGLRLLRQADGARLEPPTASRGRGRR